MNRGSDDAGSPSQHPSAWVWHQTNRAGVSSDSTCLPPPTCMDIKPPRSPGTTTRGSLPPKMQSLTLTPATQPPVDPAILKGKLEDSSPRIEYVETKDVLPVTDGNDAVPQKTYTLKEISTHNRPNDMWLVIDNEVLDVSEFKDEHPGGAKSTWTCGRRCAS